MLLAYFLEQYSCCSNLRLQGGEEHKVYLTFRLAATRISSVRLLYIFLLFYIRIYILERQRVCRIASTREAEFVAEGILITMGILVPVSELIP